MILLKVATNIAAFITSALLWIVLLFLGGASAIVFGICIVFGAGAAWMVAGVWMLCAAALLKKALTNG